MTEMLRAAVIGLGQVGWRFDEEVGRDAVWTHCGAYKSLTDDYVLVGACDSDHDARSDFSKRYPEVPVSSSISDMMLTAKPHIVSICTPANSHAKALDAVLDHDAPLCIWCEKPLAKDLDAARRMVARCSERQTRLVVSHVRRWAPLWRRFKDRLDSGEVGTVRCLRVAMPNRLWSIGSHAVDLLLWLGGPTHEIRAIDIPNLTEDDEPARAAMMIFRNGAYGILQVTGYKKALMVEAEALGDLGRLYLREDQETIEFEAYEKSNRYDGYQQLSNATIERVETHKDHSPFIEIAREVANLSRGERGPATCDGEAALETQSGLEALASIHLATEDALA